MSDRNPYLVDFSKSFKNHGKEIIESIQNNPKFQRKEEPVEEKENKPIKIQEVKKIIKPEISASALDMMKCKDIIKSASLSTLKQSKAYNSIANSLNSRKNIVLPKLATKDAAGLENLKQSLNLNISQVKDFELIETSKTRTNKIGSIIQDLDKKYFTPGKSDSVLIKQRAKKQEYHTSLIFQTMNDGSQSDIQFKIAKDFSQRLLYVGVDNFLKKKREEYKHFLDNKKKSKQDHSN